MGSLVYLILQEGYCHQAGSHEELIPIEIDLAQVRRQRVRGIRNLGQPLKSFRDNSVVFDVYNPDEDSAYLDSLGPLEKPSTSWGLRLNNA